MFGDLLAPGDLTLFPNDPTLYRLYYTGLKSSNPAVYWKQMWKRVTTQAYYLPLYAAPYIVYIAKTIGGARMSNERPAINLTELYRK
jgi:hypothetical protein